jgi:hypothetical protein
MRDMTQDTPSQTVVATGSNIADPGDSGPPLPGYGFFCQVTDEQHFKRIQSGIAAKGYFTDRVLFDRVSVRLSDIVLLISPEYDLAYAAHVRPTRGGTTGTRGFRAESPVQMDITQGELQAVIVPEAWKILSVGFTRTSFRPDAPEWNVLWNALKHLRPDRAQELRRLEQLRFDNAFEFNDDGTDAQHFYEKDAVGVALTIAGIEFHGVFAELSDGLASNRGLLQSLCGNTTEDVHVNHDVHNFPGFLPVADALHACEFAQRGRKVTIYNVNRRRGEAALGVDLIYHNETFGSYTFIQYKMLEPEGSKAARDWIYRPDVQFQEELNRMIRARNALRDGGGRTPNSYRLGQDPFFWKFCRRHHLKVNAGTLVHGHYLTLAHLQLLLTHGGPGPRGGTVIGPSTMGRWLTRSQFAPLVAEGWIGTVDVSDDMLAGYIEVELAVGNSIVVAQSSARSTDHDSEQTGDDTTA